MPRKILSVCLLSLTTLFYANLVYSQKPVAIASPLPNAGTPAALAPKSISSNLPGSLTDAQSLVFFALGDQGSASKAQRLVAAAMEREAEKPEGLDFILLLGDNFYPSGVLSVYDPQWIEKFEKIYNGPILRKTPFFAVLGNHDHRGNSDAQVKYSLQERGSNRWRMPDNFFSLDLGKHNKKPLIRLVGLDTTDPQGFARQASFIQQQFQTMDTQPIWRFAAGHHPIRSVGPHGPTRTMHQEILPAMKKSDVHIYFSGHDHNMQLIAHPNEPIQVVSGGGGKSLYKIERSSSGLRFAAVRYGFVKMVVTAKKLFLSYFDHNGKLLHRVEIAKKNGG